MSIAIDLLHAPHVGIRDLKENLSRFLKAKKPLVVTDNGTPVDVIIPYPEMLELIDIFDEIQDMEAIKTVQEAREAIRSGAKGIPVAKLFKKIQKAEK